MRQIGAEINARHADLENPAQNDSEAEERAFDEEIAKFTAGGADLILRPEGKHVRNEGYFAALDFLLHRLPDRLRASALYEAYDAHFSWSMTLIVLTKRLD